MTAAHTASLVRRAAAAERSSRDFPQRQNLQDLSVAAWFLKRRPPKCSAFSAARTGKLWTPVAVSENGRSIVISAKTNRSAPANSWAGPGRRRLNTLTRLRASADDDFRRPADVP